MVVCCSFHTCLTLQLSKAIHGNLRSARDKLQEPGSHLVVVVFHGLGGTLAEREFRDQSSTETKNSKYSENCNVPA